MTNRIRTTLVFALAAMLLVTACAPSPTGGGQTGGQTTGPKELIVGQAQDLSNLDVTQIQDQPTDSVVLNVMEPLWRRGPDYKIQNVLATEATANEDKTVWDVKLVKDVKFENGSPLTADSVKYTVDSILDPDRKPASITKAKIDFIQSVEVIDPLTVRFNLKGPNPFFRETTATLRIVDPKWFNENTKEYHSTHLMGTGPYRLVEWNKGVSAVLEPNPTWRGEKPGLTKLTYKFILESSARSAALQTGEVDIIRNATPDELDGLAKDERFTVATVDQERAIFLGINQTKGFPFTDLKFRRALNHAVDVNTIIDTVLRGYGRRIPSILSSKTYGYNGDLEPYAYDPAKAKQLLSEIDLPANFSFTYMVTKGNHPQDDLVGQAIADYFRAVGLNVNLEVLPSTEFLNRKNGRQLSELWMIGWASGSFDGYDDMSWIARTKATLWGEQLMEDPAAHAAMQRALETLDIDKRAEHLQEVQTIFHEQAYGVFMYSTVNNYVYNKNKVVNWEPPIDDNVTIQLETTVK